MLSRELPQDPATEMKTCISTKSGARMFIAIVFKIGIKILE
jgi:hypothetical protein